jgi:hypothetical protein
MGDGEDRRAAYLLSYRNRAASIDRGPERDFTGRRVAQFAAADDLGREGLFAGICQLRYAAVRSALEAELRR